MGVQGRAAQTQRGHTRGSDEKDSVGVLEANRDWGELGAIMEGVIWHIYTRQEKGMIRGDDGAQVPFRKSSLGGVEFRALASGLRVSFRVQEGWLGKEAVDVCPLSPDQAQEKR